METAKDLKSGDSAYYYEAGNVYEVEIVHNNIFNPEDNLVLHLKRAVSLFGPNLLLTNSEGNFYTRNSGKRSRILTREELEKMVESPGGISGEGFNEKEKETAQVYGDLPKTLTDICRSFLDLRERYTQQLDPSIFPVYFSSSLNLYTEMGEALFLFRRNSFSSEIMPGTAIIGSLPPGPLDKEEYHLYFGGFGPKTLSRVVPEVVEGNKIIYFQVTPPESRLKSDGSAPNFGFSTPVRRVDSVKKEDCPTGSTEETKEYLLHRFKTELRFQPENLRTLL
ncbi:MAG TPA: hypothetical protein VJA23_02270 [Candidatus Nanoarchaeia archaeon]|nr:hypothetical protein [Candidatus Nanoarchaeia archaeon]